MYPSPMNVLAFGVQRADTIGAATEPSHQPPTTWGPSVTPPGSGGKPTSALSSMTMSIPPWVATMHKFTVPMAMAASYARNRSLGWSLGAGLVSVPYLAYIGIELATKGKAALTPKNRDGKEDWDREAVGAR